MSTEKYTDHELLQLAARAIGIDEPVGPNGLLRPRRVDGAVLMDTWNPLIKIDDALELAAKLCMVITYKPDTVTVQVQSCTVLGGESLGPTAALCRSIVRAAAEIAQAEAN